MARRLFRHLSRVVALVGAAVGAACSGTPDSISGPAEPVFDDVGPFPDPFIRQAVVCKVGSSATFEVLVGNAFNSVITWFPPATHTLAAGECKTVHTYTATDGSADTVVVTELAATGIVLDSIVKDSIRQSDRVRLPAILGTASAGGQLNPSRGFILTFYNRILPPPPPPPEGGEGCTPGYWKQSQHFDSWTGYTPNQLFSSVFEDAFPGMTLVQVLAQGGGGLNALGRHTVAALLTGASAGVDSDMTTTQVINAFNNVFPGGDYEGQKNIFAAFNEQGCPLN